MVKYSYHREQYSLLNQFVAAFDDTFIFRMTKTGEPKERIDVRYIFGPKDRIIHDIVNQNKQITLPVVAMNQTSIKRDASRMQNKEEYIYRPSMGGSHNVARQPQPIPVILNVECSILCRYKEDIDQIVSNFIPYCNPYFIIAWKVPESFGMDFIDEIRSEVSWSGEVTYENPTNLANSEKFRIVGSTAFSIKGWIFPADVLTQAPIYVVRTDFKVANLENRIYTYDDLHSLSAVDYSTTDVITVSAFPEITNVFYTTSGSNIPIREDSTINSDRGNNFLVNGKRFIYNNTWYLSSGDTSLSLNYQTL